MPGPIVSRPLLRSVGGIVSVLATLTISTLLTFASGASFKFTNQQPRGVVFLDQTQTATTSRYLTVATSTNGAVLQSLSTDASTTFAGPINASSTAGTAFANAILSVNGSAQFNTYGGVANQGAVTINTNNATNVFGLTIIGGAGTSGILYYPANGLGTYSLGLTGNTFNLQTTNRSTVFQANGTAYDSTTPDAFRFNIQSGTTKRNVVAVGGQAGQTQDLFDAYAEYTSSTPVFAVGAKGNLAVGVGATTSSSELLNINGSIGSTAIVGTGTFMLSETSGFGTGYCLKKVTGGYAACMSTNGSSYAQYGGYTGIATYFVSNNTSQWILDTSGNLVPYTGRTVSLGLSSAPVTNIFATGTVTSTSFALDNGTATTTLKATGKFCMPTLNSAGTQVYVVIVGTSFSISTTDCRL